MSNTFLVHHKFTPEIQKILIENYTARGVHYCCSLLGNHFKAPEVASFCFKMGLERIPENDPPNFDIEHFKNINNPVMAYYLGLLWADGHTGTTSTTLSLAADDGVLVYEVIKSLGMFRSRLTPPRQKNSKPTLWIYFSNKEITSYLRDDMEYGKKSLVSPTKILNTIPKNLQRFFWLGYFDGDGNCYYTQNTSIITFSGAYDQDWSALESFLDNLSCVHYHRLRVSKEGKGSEINCSHKMDVIRIADLFYQTYEKDGIGLPRKRQKFLEIKAKRVHKITSANGFLGVRKRYLSKDGLTQKYVGVLRFKGKFYYTREFNDPKTTALEWDKLSVQLLGHRAKTNFPIENYIEIGYSEIYS